MEMAVDFPGRIRRLAVRDPVFVLALPCSYASIFGAMLGQHPQMYGLPQLHLFLADTMSEWWELANKSSFEMNHGLLRAVAQLIFGGQTEATVEHASGWIRRRLHYNTGLLLETLAERVQPSTVVYASSSVIRRREFLERARYLYPQARFIFVSQHPNAYCGAVVAELREAEKFGPIPEWLHRLAFRPNPGEPATGLTLDPQRTWYELSSEAWGFFGSLPPIQTLHLRGEDVLARPAAELRRVAGWLGVRDDDEALDKMEHPEDSPYARFGPNNARYGSDPRFLRAPALPANTPEPATLDGLLSWSVDRPELSTDVRRLAHTLGYG
jgi:hypothetical protein